jgi:hypothetical protein
LQNEITEVFEQLQITEKPNFNDEPVVTSTPTTLTRKRDICNQSIKNNHSNLPFEPQLEDWSKEFGDLIENEIKSLNTKRATSPANDKKSAKAQPVRQVSGKEKSITAFHLLLLFIYLFVIMS